MSQGIEGHFVRNGEMNQMGQLRGRMRGISLFKKKGDPLDFSDIIYKLLSRGGGLSKHECHTSAS
jgi:hypothetical protein